MKAIKYPFKVGDKVKMVKVFVELSKDIISTTYAVLIVKKIYKHKFCESGFRVCASGKEGNKIIHINNYDSHWFYKI